MIGEKRRRFFRNSWDSFRFSGNIERKILQDNWKEEQKEAFEPRVFQTSGHNRETVEILILYKVQTGIAY